MQPHTYTCSLAQSKEKTAMQGQIYNYMLINGHRPR